MKIRKNHETLEMLKTGVSTQAISKKFKMSYSGEKTPQLCTKLKSNGYCCRVPDSGRKLLIEMTVLLLKVPNPAPQSNNR